ncbi:TPA: GpE family phage tail protein [Escherichia coli]|nr:GpE family phage tail protein [Escherichia coli]HAW0645782.1 GpE family phage tail protein [Escherichia coli]
MADIATIFHWPPSVTDVMPLWLLLLWASAPWLWCWLLCWGRWQSSVWDSLCWVSKRYLPLRQQ